MGTGPTLGRRQDQRIPAARCLALQLGHILPCRCLPSFPTLSSIHLRLFDSWRGCRASLWLGSCREETVSFDFGVLDCKRADLTRDQA